MSNKIFILLFAFVVCNCFAEKRVFRPFYNNSQFYFRPYQQYQPRTPYYSFQYQPYPFSPSYYRPYYFPSLPTYTSPYSGLSRYNLPYSTYQPTITGSNSLPPSQSSSFRATNSRGLTSTHFPNDPPLLESTINACLQCHQNPTKPDMPKGYGEIRRVLPTMRPERLTDMMQKAGLTNEQKSEIRRHIQNHLQQDLKQTQSIGSCYFSPQENSQKTQALPELDTEDSDNSALSKVMAEKFNDAKQNNRIVFYNKSQVPLVTQNAAAKTYEGQLVPGHFISLGQRMNPRGITDTQYTHDALTDYPWVTTAGLTLQKNANSSVDHFLIPPKSGPLMKIVYKTPQSHPSHFAPPSVAATLAPKFGWEYADGTLFGEVIKTNGIASEIRLRMKVKGEWVVDMRRPFSSPDDLAKAMQDIGIKDNRISEVKNPALTKVSWDRYINPQNFGTSWHPLRLNNAALKGALPSTRIHALPDFTPKEINNLMNKRQFKSVMDKPWIKGKNGEPDTWAPSAKGNSSIVPNNYFGSHIPVTQKNCRNCHEDAGKQVDLFNPDPKTQMYRYWGQKPGDSAKDSPRSRTWYGYVRGEDHILSFHGFTKNATLARRTVDSSTLNSCLIQKGLIANPYTTTPYYNPDQPPSSYYPNGRSYIPSTTHSY